MDRELARVGASLSRRLFSGVPARIGRYRIAGRIGSGGMGDVYRGHDPTLDRPVAIKVLGSRSAVSAPTLDRDALVDEARALASVSHPNVVEVYEVGSEGGSVYIVMELVDGVTLRDWASDERPRWSEIVRAYVQAGDGLQAAHEAGIVHRDFKPSNVLMARDGRARVLDFGVATQVTEVDGTVIVGTPTYMAPEALRGLPATPKSDQYSFCVALWAALFGGMPFAASTVEGLRRANEVQRLVRPTKTPVPRVVVDALARGLSQDPKDRWDSMASLLASLRTTVKPRGPLRAVVFATGWVGWKVAAGAIVVALFPAFGDADPCAALQTRRAEDWSVSQRGVLEAAFEANGRAESWQGFEEVVDAQVRGLSDGYAEVCEARRSDAGAVEVDTELACLRRRYLSLQGLVEAIPTADASQLARIEAAVVESAAKAACADGPVRVLPPRIVAALSEADAKLAEADVLRTADRTEEAAQLLQALAVDAQELQYAPLQARIALARARVDVIRGALDDAEDALVSAYQYAVGLSDHQLAMTTAAQLAELLGVELSRPTEALEWVRHSEAAAVRLGRAEPRAHLWRILANIHFNAGEHEQAAVFFERAAEAIGKGGTHNSRQRIEDLGKQAAVQLHLEHVEQAREAFSVALALAEQEYGPESHNVAAIGFNLGLATNDPVQRVALFQRSATIYESLWDDHPDLGDALFRWGQSLAAVGSTSKAEELMRRGIAMLARGIGETHPYVLDARTSLIALLSDEGRYEEAFDLAVSVHADAQAKMGDAHPVTAGARQSVAAALDGLGDADGARVAYEDAARLSRESPEPDVRMVLRTTASLAEFRARHGELDAGRAQLEQAAARASDVVGDAHPLWADLQLRAVALLPDSQSEPEDLERARAALDVLGEGIEARGYARALFSVVRLEDVHGDRVAARAQAEALAARLRQSPRDASLAQEVERWLARRDRGSR